MEAVLSNTEREVLELRIKGFSRKEIAEKTFRSEKTIKTHFQNIQLKKQMTCG
jgi:DNA-binding NarL/FixJ family response regulator